MQSPQQGAVRPRSETEVTDQLRELALVVPVLGQGRTDGGNDALATVRAGRCGDAVVRAGRWRLYGSEPGDRGDTHSGMSPHDRWRDYLAPVSLYPTAVPVRATHRLSALLRSCHPEPTIAVTVFVTALSAASGQGAGGAVAAGSAVLAGQLSIGWCNDAVDAVRDTASGRRDKPLAGGALRPRTVAVAAVLALLLCVPLSLLSGVAAAAVHVTGVVAGGWAYNLVLKSTLLSPVPYAVGFASLPAFVTLGAPTPAWPAWWAVVTSALLGVGAHWVNALPDIADDLATGVRGLPQRLGPVACRRLTLVTLLAAVDRKSVV